MKKPHLFYLHGLDGNLSDEKRSILEQYGQVTAPQLNYRNETDVVRRLAEEYKGVSFDALIGNSMGGRVCFHLHQEWKLPALLFNPPLFKSIPGINLPLVGSLQEDVHSLFLKLVLGAKDDVVNPYQTIIGLPGILSDDKNYQVSWHNLLPHRINGATFELEIEAFINRLQSQKKIYS